MTTFGRASQAADFFAEAQAGDAVWFLAAADGALVAQQGPGGPPAVAFWSTRDRIPRVGDVAAEIDWHELQSVPFEEWCRRILPEVRDEQLLVALDARDVLAGEPAARVQHVLEEWLAARVQEGGVGAGLTWTPNVVVGYARVPWWVRLRRSIAAGRPRPSDGDDTGLVRTTTAHAVPVSTPDTSWCGARIGRVDLGSVWPITLARPCEACRALADDGASDSPTPTEPGEPRGSQD